MPIVTLQVFKGTRRFLVTLVRRDTSLERVPVRAESFFFFFLFLHFLLNPIPFHEQGSPRVCPSVRVTKKFLFFRASIERNSPASTDPCPGYYPCLQIPSGHRPRSGHSLRRQSDDYPYHGPVLNTQSSRVGPS